ncbi:MAG TPA: hypothetical protein VH163_02440 [Gemmatimonadales bacterium]|jgi:hypothetical protein|nr:hypothetical protein [Gemmatimonadales bacterium]
MNVVRQTSIPDPTVPTPSFVKRFDTPERSVGFGDGRLDIITIAGRAVGRGSFAAGWKWTPTAGVKSAAFAGVVLSGRAKVKTKAGESADLSPGDFFVVAPEDEFWVVGLRPCEILYLDGIDDLA